MKLSGPAAAVPVFGIAAALGVHNGLQTIERLGFRVASYATHTHTSVASTFCVEALLAVLLLCLGAREAVGAARLVTYRRPLQPPIGRVAAAIAAIACATLFGMEFFESGTAALGLGWIGGSLLPGLPVFGIVIAIVVGAYWLLFGDRTSVYDRLIAIVASFLSAFSVERCERARPTRARRVRVGSSNHYGRTARLRGPPLPTA